MDVSENQISRNTEFNGESGDKVYGTFGYMNFKQTQIQT